ncbi:hypothetical protein NT239_03525 [Chitinibacter sp. SCUT-21]|uniref:hypothetical protein n=1 Tax=Chitinibacter sp. SCUT-21 TaxID=2970891 RepID=UPI0035A63346
MGNINYRAVHTKSIWRKVSNHQSIESAINGKDGATGLFARKVRINYETHGDPCYVVVWEQGAQSGFVIKPDPATPNGIRQVSIPIAVILAFESKGQVSQLELDSYF